MFQKMLWVIALSEYHNATLQFGRIRLRDSLSLESFRMLMYFVLLLCLKSIMQPSCSTEHYPVGNSRELEIPANLKFLRTLYLLCYYYILLYNRPVENFNVPSRLNIRIHCHHFCYRTKGPGYLNVSYCIRARKLYFTYTSKQQSCIPF